MAADTIILKYLADIKDFVAGTTKVQTEIKDTETEFEKLGKTIQDGFIKGSDGAKRFITELKRQPQTVAELELKHSRLIELLRDEAKIGTQAHTLIKKEIDKTKHAIDGATQSAGKFQQETKKLSSSVGDFKTQLTALAGAMGLTFSVQQVVEFGKESVKAFIEAEENAAKLSFAVRQIGGGTGSDIDELIKQSTELQKKGIFSDDEIQQAQTALFQYGLTTEQVKRLTPAIVELATATDKNLGSATERIISGINGQSRGLKQVGLQFKDTGDKAKNFEIILDGITNKFAGSSAAAMETNAGKAANLKNQYGELQETIGGLIINELDPLIQSLTKLNDEFTMDNLGNWTDALVKAADVITDFNPVANIQKRLINGIGEELGFVNKEIDIAEESQMRLDAALRAVNEGGWKLEQLFQQLSKTIPISREQFDKYIETWKENRKQTDENANSTAKIIGAYQQLNEELGKLTTKINNILAKGGIVSEADARRAAELQAKLKAINDQRDKLLREQGILIKIAPDKIGFEESIKEMEGDLLPVQVPVEFSSKNTLEEDLQFWQNKWESTFNSAMGDNEQEKKDAEKKKQERLAIANATFQGLSQLASQFQALQNQAYNQELANLEKEKNIKLSNAKLTAKERARIEAEFAKKEQAIKRKQFEDNKTGSIIQAIINTALGVTQAIAQGGVAGIITGALVAAAGAVEIGTIAAQENPYFKGTPYLERKGAPKGRDTIRIRANEGEAIIPTDRNAEKPGLAAAWINGKVDDYIMTNYAAPLLKKQAEIYNREVLKSVVYQSNSTLDDKRILRELRMGNQISDSGFAALAQSLKRNKRTGLN